MNNGPNSNDPGGNQSLAQPQEVDAKARSGASGSGRANVETVGVGQSNAPGNAGPVDAGSGSDHGKGATPRRTLHSKRGKTEDPLFKSIQIVVKLIKRLVKDESSEIQTLVNKLLKEVEKL